MIFVENLGFIEKIVIIYFLPYEMRYFNHYKSWTGLCQWLIFLKFIIANEMAPARYLDDFLNSDSSHFEQMVSQMYLNLHFLNLFLLVMLNSTLT